MEQGIAFLPNTPNFLGMLFNADIRKTQFLSLIGGTEGANALITTNPEFPISVDYAIGNPSQPEISESDAVGVASPTYIGRTQNKNVIQIFQEDVTVSRLRERASGRLSGINTAGETPEQDSEIAFQLMMHMEKMKRDMNWTAINGSFDDTGLTDSDEVLQTRGIISAITSNVVDGSTISTSEDLTDAIDEMIKLAYDNGNFDTPVICCNSTNRLRISKAYHAENLTEVDRTRFVAGVAVERIVTNFGQEVFIITDNDTPNSVIFLCDQPSVRPVFTTDKETGEIITIKPLSQRGGNSYEIYSEFGLDHGAEKNHAKIIDIPAIGEY